MSRQALPIHSPRNQDQQPSWFCEHCRREVVSNKPLIYGVSLCFKCIVVAAGEPRRAYHLQCLNYEQQQHITRLESVLGYLHGRFAMKTAVTKALAQKLSDEAATHRLNLEVRVRINRLCGYLLDTHSDAVTRDLEALHAEEQYGSDESEGAEQ